MSAGLDRQRLVAEAVPWVAKLAARMKRRWPTASLDELVALGNLTAAEAATDYDPAQGAFQQFAFKAVRGAMMSEAIRATYGHDAQLAKAMSAFTRDQEHQLDSVEELLDSSIGGLGATERDLARDQTRQQLVPMLIASARAEADARLDPSEELERAELLHAVRETVGGLEPAQQAFVEWFYGHDESLEAIAKRGVGPAKDLRRFHQKLKERVAVRLSRLAAPA